MGGGELCSRLASWPVQSHDRGERQRLYHPTFLGEGTRQFQVRGLVCEIP